MSRVSFSRLSGAPPPARELVDVEADGSWTAWRSSGGVVGRFGGSGGRGDEIVALADAVRDAGVPALPQLPPDATVDSLEVDGRTLRTGHTTVPEGPWGALVDACRRLLDEAVDHPSAAIGLVIASADRLRLEHRGSDVLVAELTPAEAEATVWTEVGEFLTAGQGRLELGRVDAGPGWSAEVALAGIDAAAAERGNPVASVSFVLEDEGVYVPALLHAGRAPG